MRVTRDRLAEDEPVPSDVTPLPRLASAWYALVRLTALSCYWFYVLNRLLPRPVAMGDITVQFRKLHAKAQLPARQSAHAAGYDVYACGDDDIVILRGQVQPVPTGLAVEIPAGYHISIRARSGMAVKHGLTPINTPGTIDADYRGEIFVPLINLGREDYVVKPGERIAQLLLEKTYTIAWQEAELSETERGEGKFGSTGKR